MAGDTKKEHYVPQVYLRRFCSSPDKVNVYDKINNEIRINQPLINVASERYFYDVDLFAYNEELKARGEATLDVLFPGFEKTDPQYIEHMFGNGIEGAYEQKIGIVIDDLLKKGDWWLNNCYAITQEEKVFFALWAAHQFVRTKSFRETVSKINQAAAQAVTEFANRDVPEDEKVIASVRTDKIAKQALHADMIMNTKTIAHFAEIMFLHSWIITVNKSKFPFVTSDNPITTIPHDFSHGFAGSGIASPKVEIFFPLSPYIGIMMFEKQHGFEKYDCRSVICSDPETIMQYNYATLSNAHRLIVANTTDLTIYQEYVKLHPEIQENKLSLYIGGKTFLF